MAIGKTFKSLVDKFRTTDAAASPWFPRDAPYPLLVTFDPVMVQPVAGIAAVWHLGVRPQWLKIAAAANLQVLIRSAAQNAAIISYRPNGGVYLAWAPLPANQMHGAAAHLIGRLKPALQTVRLHGEVDIPADAKHATIPDPPGTEG